MTAKKTSKKKAAKKKAPFSFRRTRSVAQDDGPRPLVLFKIVKRRGRQLTSLFTRGKLRLTYNKRTATKAPAPSLPITGFDTLSNAERFLKRNRARKQKMTWVIVEGVGVPADDRYIKPQRMKRVCDIKATTIRGVQAAVNKHLEAKWSKGTVFVTNFKITKQISEHPVRQ